jgi:hypothetical protein
MSPIRPQRSPNDVLYAGCWAGTTTTAQEPATESAELTGAVESIVELMFGEEGSDPFGHVGPARTEPDEMAMGAAFLEPRVRYGRA